jgi:hypothetical protein
MQQTNKADAFLKDDCIYFIIKKINKQA